MHGAIFNWCGFRPARKRFCRSNNIARYCPFHWRISQSHEIAHLSNGSSAVIGNSTNPLTYVNADKTIELPEIMKATPARSTFFVGLPRPPAIPSCTSYYTMSRSCSSTHHRSTPSAPSLSSYPTINL